MKKTILILCVVAIILTLTGCNTANEVAANEGLASENEIVPNENAEEEAGENEKTLEDVSQESVSGTSPLNGKKIGCTIIYKGDEWCSALAACLEETAKKYGADIVVEDGDNNAETQTKQIENMLANDVDMIFADPATPDGCTGALMKAVDSGVPVFIYDCYWNEADQAVTSITWDQALTGELVAKYLIDYVAAHPDEYPDGAANVVLLELYSSDAAMQRSERFREILEQEAPNIKIVEVHDCEGNREKAANAIANTAVPFNFVVSVVDNGAWGAISAIQAAALNDVKVLSMGAYGAEPFEALYRDDPNYLACVVVDPQVIADGLFEAAERHLNGETIDKTTYIDIFLADASNVTNFWEF